MPASNTTFGFTDYAQQLQNIERRRKLAEALMQQGLEPAQAQPAVGGIVTPISPWSTMAQAGKTMLGAYGMKEAETKTEEIGRKRQEDLVNALRSMNIPEDKIPSTVQMLNMPETALMGQSQIQMQMLKNALNKNSGNPMDPSSPNPSVMAGGGGQLEGMAPLDLLGAGDMGKTVWQGMNEMNKPMAGRAGAPIYRNGRIIGFSPKLDEGMTMNPQGQVSMAPGYAEAKTGVGSIPNPSAPMIPVKTSTGQDIQLTQPEYLVWQGTGQLPARMGGRPSGQTPFNPMSPQGRPGLGVPGVGQSQEEQITQERQKAAGKAADEAFAKDYVAFKTGGAQDATKQLSQLQDVVNRLQEGKGLTGPVIGRAPDVVTNFTNPKVVATRERVEEVVQRSLRAILGAQFTEKEGERLIARAYNPSQPEAENAVRVQRLLTQLGSALQNKMSAAAYFEKNGTLQGWTGKLPNISDFDVEQKEVGGRIKFLGFEKK